MKKDIFARLSLTAILLVAGVAGASSACYGQDFTRVGNTFKASPKAHSSSKDTLVTGLQWEDSRGTKYPIVINRQSGRCYIWKVSGKTGRYYKMYLKPEVSMQVCRETGVEYRQK